MKNFVRHKRHMILAKLILLFSVFISLDALAIPQNISFQSKIYKPDGTPLEAANVQFKFSIMNPISTCIIYSEAFSGIDLTGTGGSVVLTLGGAGAVPSFNDGGVITNWFDAFNNATASFNCQSSGTYSPALTDTRRLVMQFNDGTPTGWQTLPPIDINSVPYAMFAQTAETVSSVNPSLITDGGASLGQVLKWNGTNWIASSDNTGSSAVSGSNGAVNITASGTNQNMTLTPSGTGVLTTPSVTTITNATASTTSSNGALVVSGGVGVGGALNVTTDIKAGSAMFSPIYYGGTAASGDVTFDSTSNGAKGNVLIAPSGGNVGIGTTTPTAKLDVVGQTRSIAPTGGANINASAAVNWNNGNAQSMSVDCATTTFTNMLDGGTYVLAVSEAGTSTCTFSQAGLTFFFQPANGPRSSGKRTVYTFQRIGTDVYVSWIKGFQ